MIRKTIEFILFSSVFIACCAVAMCIETSLLMHLPLNSLSFYSFVFGATSVQNNLHYLVKRNAVKGSRRMTWSMRNRSFHLGMIAFGSGLIIFSLFSFHLHHFIFLLLLGAIACLYSFPVLPFQNKKRLKDFGVLKITTLALLWTLITVWFPVNQMNFNVISFGLVFLRRFVFMFILCLLFDIRDTEVDSQENIRTIPVIIGSHKSYIICYSFLSLFVLLSLIQFLHSPELLPLSVMLASAVATLFTIKYTKKHNSDFIYLALVDGMMLLQALLVIITSVYFL